MASVWRMRQIDPMGMAKIALAVHRRFALASRRRSDRLQRRDYRQSASQGPRLGQIQQVQARRAAPIRDSTGDASPTTRWSRARSTTSKRRPTRTAASVPREHLVLYQFSARGHDVAQVILGSLIDHQHDAASAYYRSRPLLLALGLTIEDALGSPLGRAGGFSDGRDIGVVCNLPNRDGADRASDVGRRRLAVHAGRRLGAGGSVSPRRARATQSGRARSASCSAAKRRSRRTASGRRSRWRRRSSCRCSSTSKTTGSASRCAATCRRRAATSRRTSRRSAICSFATATAAIPRESAALLAECVDHVRARQRAGARASHRAAAVQPLRPGQSEAAIAPTTRSRPTSRAIRCRSCGRISCPALMSEEEWTELEAEVARDVQAGARRRARAARIRIRRPSQRFVYAETPRDGDVEAFGGLIARGARDARRHDGARLTTATSCASPKPCVARLRTSSR